MTNFLTVERVVFVLVVGSMGFLLGIFKGIFLEGFKRVFSVSSQDPVSVTQPKLQREACKDCICLERITKFESCNTMLKGANVGNQKDIEHLFDRQDKTDHRMELLESSIHSMDRKLERILVIVEERTSQGGGINKKKAG